MCSGDNSGRNDNTDTVVVIHSDGQWKKENKLASSKMRKLKSLQAEKLTN